MIVGAVAIADLEATAAAEPSGRARAWIVVPIALLLLAPAVVGAVLEAEGGRQPAC